MISGETSRCKFLMATRHYLTPSITAAQNIVVANTDLAFSLARRSHLNFPQKLFRLIQRASRWTHPRANPLPRTSISAACAEQSRANSVKAALARRIKICKRAGGRHSLEILNSDRENGERSK